MEALIIAPNTLALFRLNQNLVDSGPNTYTWTENGTIPFATTPQPVRGSHSAGPWSGANNLRSTSAFDTAFSDLTVWAVEFWANWPVVIGGGVVVSWEDTDVSDDFNINIGPAGGTVQYAYPGGFVRSALRALFIDDTVHLKWGSDGTRDYVYRNDLKIIDIATRGGTQTVGNFTIGAQFDNVAPWNGQLQEVRISTAWTVDRTEDTNESIAAVANGSSQIDLTWTDLSAGAFYNIYRNTVDTFSTSTLVGSAVQGDEAWSDKGLPSSTKQFYWIVMHTNLDLVFFQAYEMTISVNATTTSSGTSAAVTNLSVNTPISSSKLTIVWTDDTGGIADYLCYFNTVDNFSTSTPFAYVPAGVELATASSLSGNTTYYFWVVAIVSPDLGPTVGSVNATTLVAASDFLTEIGDHLISEGIVNGATGWLLSKSFMPAKPAQMVVIYETPGFPSDVISEGSSETAYDQPSFQVRVRGDVRGYEAARQKIQQVYLALHAMEPGVNFVYLYSDQSGPMPMGDDDNDRPELTWNFVTFKDREE